MTITEAMLGDATFGCELEYTGISREHAAQTVAQTVGGTARYEGCHLNNWVVTMRDGRRWQIVSDASVAAGCETVTPILTIEDMDLLLKVVNALRNAGARAGGGAGLHIHIGAKDMTPEQIKNLVRIFYKQEELILKAAGTSGTRLGWYTRRTDKQFVERICGMRAPTMESLNKAWFGSYTANPAHYDPHRYRAMNLNNLWGSRAKRTVEFRFFEATANAQTIRTDVLLALLLVVKAKMAKAASAKNRRAYNEASAKYDLRVFLLRLGMIGPYYRIPRKILMKNLPGSAAWKDGRHD